VGSAQPAGSERGIDGAGFDRILGAVLVASAVLLLTEI
jgi:hypothetical protein